MVHVECSGCSAKQELETAKTEGWWADPEKSGICPKCQEAKVPDRVSRPLTRDELVCNNKELRERAQAAEDKIKELESKDSVENHLVGALMNAVEETQKEYPKLTLGQCVGALGVTMFAKLADSLLEDKAPPSEQNNPTQ